MSRLTMAGLLMTSPAVSLVNDGRPGRILVNVIRPQGKI